MKMEAEDEMKMKRKIVIVDDDDNDNDDDFYVHGTSIVICVNKYPTRCTYTQFTDKK